MTNKNDMHIKGLPMNVHILLLHLQSLPIISLYVVESFSAFIITVCTFLGTFRKKKGQFRMLKIHSRVSREHLHVLRWKSKERSWHHGMAQGNLPKLTCLRGKSSVVHSGSNIHYGKTPDKSLHLDLHRLVQSFNKSINKNVLGLLKQIPIKSIFKKFSSYADRFKLGWQEDSEKVSLLKTIVS